VVALVTWASGVDPSAPTPAGVFAAVAEPSAAFDSPQRLADARTATLPQPSAGAITQRSRRRMGRAAGRTDRAGRHVMSTKLHAWAVRRTSSSATDYREEIPG
jgi:hypothetical protein